MCGFTEQIPKCIDRNLMTNNSIHHGHPSKGCLLSKILESGFFSGLNIVDELFVATDQLWWRKKFRKIARCLRCIDIIKIDLVCCNFRNWEVVYNPPEGNLERESYRKKDWFHKTIDNLAMANGKVEPPDKTVKTINILQFK